MAVQDYKINYKSDFVLNINGDAGWATQFCIKFWTGMPSQAYFVGFDGVKYVNCRVGDTPTQLLVMFDDHHLPIGKLMMQIAYHTTIEEFPGSVFDEVTNARDVIVTIDGTDYQVLLDFTGEDAPELEFNLPAYANEAERIQNELQRQQNEADRIAAELQREQATAAAVQGAENVNAQLNGTTLTVTNRQGVSTSVNTKGEQGAQGPIGPEGPQGEQGVSIVSFRQVYASETATYYSITFSDGHEQSVAIPKGAKGDTGATGPTGPQGPQGQTGVSITGFVETGETETDTLYNITFSNGTTQQVAIPKGEKGDQGPVGPQGPQGPMGDVAVITTEQQAAFTMYSETGQNTNGPMTQKAVTDALIVIDSDNIINGYSDSLGFMSTSGNNVIWISNNSNRKHKAIPVSGEQFVKITASANIAIIAFATSSYTTPTSSSHGHTISSLCANTGLYNINENSTSVLPIPDDCAYVLVNVTSNGSTYYTPNSLYLGNNINSIVKDNKNAIDEEVIGSLPISLNMKRYIATNKAVGQTVNTTPLFNNTTQSYAYAIIPCASGDIFKITGKGGSTPRLWCFVDSSYKILAVEYASVTRENIKKTAPATSAYIIVNVDTREPYNVEKLLTADNSRIDRIDASVDGLVESTGNYVLCPYDVVVGSYNSDTGVLGATSDYNRISTAKIACTGINSIKTNCKMNNYTASITVLFYDSSDNYLDKIVSKYNGNEYTEIAVPADAAYFAMNLTSIGEDVSYVKIYLQKTNGYIESIESIESQMSGIGTVEVADVDICLSDFKTNSNSDDDAIKDMLDYGNMFVKKTYHIDIPVTISKVIYLQSNTTMLVEEDIKQADGMFECVFRGGNVVLDDNDFAYLPTNIEQIENVRIIGVGEGRLIEGPDVNYVINHPTYGNQAAVGDYYGIRTHQIDLTMCSNFEIANLSFTKTRGWCLNFDFCDHGKIHDLHISSNVKNGDGVDIRTGCHDIEIYNVNGDTSDDLLAINGSTDRTATGTTSSLPYMYGSEASGKMRPYFLDRRRFDIHDINAHDCQYQRVVANVGCVMIVVAQKGTRVYNINLDNLTEISTLAGMINIFLGSFRDSNNTYTDGDVHNVRINRAHSTTSNACVTANKVCRNVWVNKCVADNNVLGEIIDHNTNGFTFTNSVGNVVEYPGYPNLD